MESEQVELHEGIAEDWADLMVAAIKILLQTFIRVRQKMPFEEWFSVYMEDQGYIQEEFRERMDISREEFDRLPPQDKKSVIFMALQKIPKKLEKLETPEPVKGFFSNLVKLIPPPTVEQLPVYECDNCHQQFTIPQQDFEKVTCPSCGRDWTVEELAKLKIK